MLGWNIIYGFNDSDFEVSENLLSLYLDEYEETPWDALKYLIADVNYGGHVTDDWDRRLMQSYIYDYFTDEAIGAQYFKLSTLDQVCDRHSSSTSIRYPEYHIHQIFSITFQKMVH